MTPTHTLTHTHAAGLSALDSDGARGNILTNDNQWRQPIRLFTQQVLRSSARKSPPFPENGGIKNEPACLSASEARTIRGTRR